MNHLQCLLTGLSKLAVRPIPICCAVAATALLNPFAAVQAAQATAGTNSMVNAGFATATFSWPAATAEANGYEFKAGVGVSAFATGHSRVVDGVKLLGNISASARASFSDSFRVALDQVADIGSATSFELTVPIKADGTADISYTFNPHPLSRPDATDHVWAYYDYEWSVGGLSGKGQYGKLRGPFGNEKLTDTATGGLSAVFRVSLGQQVNLSLSAHATAYAHSIYGTASGAADFDHTLSWGGVSGITGFDSAGNPVALPEGFSLSLVSAETGFNYMNAAGPNPYTTAPVPEPASWALMLAGGAVIAAAMRRRPLGG